ncbi:hypothetical protein SCP_0804790 [Sparassis crispa]|uniref:Uncharacterized protein n=1 Tax=Sparassis crispa TaxID=139825 RepID=A0A401GUP5_9APHY|nr:hypothetical protein SCP_0804790 [Sparassis crispa]GBE85955.1 hypothetical protein SCP_0804790 [Sparassis crispa]
MGVGLPGLDISRWLLVVSGRATARYSRRIHVYMVWSDAIRLLRTAYRRKHLVTVGCMGIVLDRSMILIAPSFVYAALLRTQAVC